MLNQLKAKYEHHGVSSLTQEDTEDMSGIEIDSPHKVLSTSNEFPCILQGIGELRTLWIGQKGVQSIKRKVAEERSTDQVRSLSSDLKKLASTCHKAFEVAGLINSEQEAVKDAVELCKLHLPQPKESKKQSSAIAHLWKKPTEETHSSKDPVKLATSVLGEKLVDTLTEKNREPPDVS